MSTLRIEYLSKDKVGGCEDCPIVAVLQNAELLNYM